MSKEVIDKLPNLKVVSKFGVGLDGIDVDSLADNSIKLAWKPGINATSVAELALCYLILMLREAQQLNRDLLSGTWSKVKNSRDLSEVTIGIIGFGQIGKTLASFLDMHGSDILVFDPFIENIKHTNTNIELVDLECLLRKSDAITLHLPLSDLTKSMIGDREIKLMKQGSFLVNLSRGGIVCERAVASALKENHLGGAAFDVFENEPQNNPDLVAMRNFFSTPHIAGTSRSASAKLGLSAIDGLLESIQQKES